MPGAGQRGPGRSAIVEEVWCMLWCSQNIPFQPLNTSSFFCPCHWSLGFVLAHQMCWLLGCDSAPSIHWCSVPEHLFEQFWILPYDTASILLLFVSICVFPMYRKQRGRKTKREKIVGVASSPQICYWHLLTVFPLTIPDINKKARENPLTVLLIWEGAAHQRRASDCGAACLTPGCAA